MPGRIINENQRPGSQMTVCKRISLHENSHFQSPLQVCCWWYFPAENDTSIQSSLEENLSCSRGHKVLPFSKRPGSEARRNPALDVRIPHAASLDISLIYVTTSQKRDNYVDWDCLFTHPCRIWNETEAPDLLTLPCTADVEVPCQKR